MSFEFRWGLNKTHQTRKLTDLKLVLVSVSADQREARQAERSMWAGAAHIVASARPSSGILPRDIGMQLLYRMGLIGNDRLHQVADGHDTD